MSKAQSRKDSFRESCVNTFSGFVLSMLIHKYVVIPTLKNYESFGGDPAGWLAAFSVTLLYTTMSLIRNYIIRRLHS